MLNSGRNWPYFVPSDLEIWCMTLKNNSAPLLYYIKLCASFQSHGWIKTGVTLGKHSILVKMSNIFVLCDLGIWWMTLRNNNRAPLLCGFKLWASFHTHWWIQTGVTVRKRPIQVKNNCFLGHLFYTTLSFVHHIKAMGEYKLEL